MTIISYLVAGLLLYGGIGWLLDWWLKTGFFFPTGIIVGAVAGMYVIIRRYGRT
ncbi:MAG: AtpZ/AtpI family protein [Micropruina sp.]|nr:MAG: AtpZ/AtpI family protein [Micropruina sp.]